MFYAYKDLKVLVSINSQSYLNVSSRKKKTLEIKKHEKNFMTINLRIEVVLQV